MRTLPLSRAALALFCLLPLAAFAGDLKIAFLDVGQGDAAVVIAPGGCAAVIDGGPTGSGATIKSYLASQGITRVDFVIATHYHEDHVGGLDEITSGTNAVTVTAAYDRGGSYSTTAYTQYANAFAGKRHTATRGQVISLCSQVAFQVVSVAGNGVSSTNENTLSVGVKITYGALDVIVAGDLVGTSPDDVESTVAPTIGQLEVYKVHHHGSRYSSLNPILDAMMPTVSVISVGVGNTYGHPTAEALSRLQAHNSIIYQTEDPSTNTKRGNVVITSTTGSSFIVAQGGSSTTYASKGGGTGDTTPPAAPANLTAAAQGSSEIDLGWTASTDNVGVSSYRVYKSTNGSTFSQAGTSTTTGFADTGLAASTTYWYRVTALDAAGNESANSNTASATTGAGTPGRIILNEILANEPGSSTAGEFIELVNAGGTSVSIGGWTLWDASASHHTFAAGTSLAPGKAIVVFGASSGIPGGLTNAVASSTGGLSLNNTGDTVSVRNGTTIVDSYTYSSSLAGVDGVSMNRSPDATAGAAFVLHTSLSARSSSPGVRPNGTAY